MFRLFFVRSKGEVNCTDHEAQYNWRRHGDTKYFNPWDKILQSPVLEGKGQGRDV